jgi:hypothetical protein
MKTHCKQGHEFTPENTRITEDGSRVCKTCTRMRDASYRQMNLEAKREKDRIRAQKKRDAHPEESREYARLFRLKRTAEASAPQLQMF